MVPVSYRKLELLPSHFPLQAALCTAAGTHSSREASLFFSGLCCCCFLFSQKQTFELVVEDDHRQQCKSCSLVCDCFRLQLQPLSSIRGFVDVVEGEEDGTG